MAKRTSSKINRNAVALPIRVALLIGLLIFWQIVASSNQQIAFYTSYPTAILSDMRVFFSESKGWMHIATTCKEAYLGLLYGSLIGVVFGVLFSQFPTLGKVIVPLISAFQSIPQLTLAPLYILWFGIGFTSKVVLSSLMVFFNVFFSTYNGIRGLDQHLIESAMLLGASKTQILTNIVIPSSMPWIMSGIRIGSSVCMVGAIIGEYIGASSGLGWMVTYATSFFKIDRVMACIFILMIIGLVVTWLLEKLEKYLLRWRSDLKLQMD